MGGYSPEEDWILEYTDFNSTSLGSRENTVKSPKIVVDYFSWCFDIASNVPRQSPIYLQFGSIARCNSVVPGSYKSCNKDRVSKNVEGGRVSSSYKAATEMQSVLSPPACKGWMDNNRYWNEQITVLRPIQIARKPASSLLSLKAQPKPCYWWLLSMK